MINKSLLFILLVIFCFGFLKVSFSEDPQSDNLITQRFKRLRQKMVQLQIESRGIKDQRLLKAMQKVERHKFLPLYLQSFAYEDRALPIAEGQTISQPYIVALMTELLGLKDNDKVLEIGTGSGYQAAILAELAKEVYTIEIIPGLAKQAQQLLFNLGYRNIKVRCGNGYAGWPEYAPFDAIIVTCAPPELPQELINQLKEGGRMVVPVGENFQVLKLIVKKEVSIIEKDIIPVLFVPMVKEE